MMKKENKTQLLILKNPTIKLQKNFENRKMRKSTTNKSAKILKKHFQFQSKQPQLTVSLKFPYHWKVSPLSKSLRVTN